MKKWILLFGIFLTISVRIACAASSSGVEIVYAEAVDYFEIMENLSAWHPGCDPVYRKTLKEKFIKTDKDEHWLEWYVSFRQKMHSEKVRKVNDKSLFGSAWEIKPDAFSVNFHTSTRPMEALKKIKRKLKKDDYVALGKFYEHFNSRIAELVRVSATHASRAKDWTTELKKAKIKNLFRKAVKFYAIPSNRLKKVRVALVWYPKSMEPSVSFSHQTVIVRMHPSIESSFSMERISREIMRFVSRNQSSGQNTVVSSRVFSVCDPRDYFPPRDILEKPLAYIFGNIMVSETKNRKNFELHRQWSINPWVNVYAKMLFPLVKKTIKNKQTIMSDEFLNNASRLCNELVEVGKFLSVK
ncbi:MAG: hypothetical protein KAQ98_13805 [Bacteriovoracaceae bacterium]|nr:hypothetical protein [Bacteriovoracaceae bacterium]